MDVHKNNRKANKVKRSPHAVLRHRNRKVRSLSGCDTEPGASNLMHT